jgi:hypothetical protein
MKTALQGEFVMNTQSFSGMVIALGFVLYVAAMLAAPRLYDTEDIGQRVAVIASSQVRWNVSQLLFALGAAVPAVGFVMLAFSQRGTRPDWLFFLGAVLFAAGAAIEMWLVYRQTLDPAAFWEGAQTPAIIGFGFLLLTLLGMLCLGIAMILGGFPPWMGYLLGGTAVLLLIVTAILRGQGGFFVSIIAYSVTFIVGFALWWLG